MDNSHFAAFIGGLLLGLVIGFIVSTNAVTDQMRSDAVEHGAAEYDSQTGEWRWKESVK